MYVNSILANDGSICIVVDGKVYTVIPSHAHYKQVYNMIKSESFDVKVLRSALGIDEALNEYRQGKVHVDVEEGVVTYDGVVWPDKGLVERILRIISSGISAQPILNFLDNLGQNPSFRSIMEMFQFISHHGLPITEDGYILAYKAVNDAYLDKWTRTKDNHVGSVVKENRALICDDPKQPCARGLHAGTMRYANTYGSQAGDRMIIIKIHPKDVVCVPVSDIEKMRVCEYVVVCDHDRKTLLDKEVYDLDCQPIQSAFLVELLDRGIEPNIVNDDSHCYGNYESPDWDEDEDYDCYDDEDEDEDEEDDWDDDDYDDED